MSQMISKSCTLGAALRAHTHNPKPSQNHSPASCGATACGRQPLGLRRQKLSQTPCRQAAADSVARSCRHFPCKNHKDCGGRISSKVVWITVILAFLGLWVFGHVWLFISRDGQHRVTSFRDPIAPAAGGRVAWCESLRHKSSGL